MERQVLSTGRIVGHSYKVGCAGAKVELWLTLLAASCQNVTDDMPAKLTKEIIEAAIDGFEAQKHKINIQIAELRALLMGDTAKPADTPASSAQPRRRISAAARKRMAAAQRKRWAAVKSQATTPAKTATPKRKLSAAGRAAIVAAMKKRWAEKKAAAKK